LRRWFVASLAVAVLAGVTVCAALAAAQKSPYAVPARVSVTAYARGNVVRSVLRGERWTLRGKLVPGAAGQKVTIDVRRSGRSVLTKRVSVRRVTGGRVGHFKLRARFRRAGRLTIVARVATNTPAAAASEPIRVAVRGVGRRRPGCGFAPKVSGTPRRRAARVGGRVLSRGVLLATSARIRVPERGRLHLAGGGARFVAAPGVYVVDCQGLRVVRGRAVAEADARERARLLVPPAVALLRGPGRVAATTSPEQFRYRRGTGYVASSRAPTSRVRTIDGDRVVLTPDGLARMITWPFARSPDERRARPSDRLPAFWADGRSCSVGCRPAGARTGWPLEPFHEQHALRAGLNEWRAANMHFGIDISARNGQAVHAIQAGTARIGSRGTTDVHVDVGNYEYWHVTPSVPEGAHVGAGEVVGHILRPEGHVHLAETRGGRYLNPLRPGGRVLEPWSDRERPIVGPPHRVGGTVFNEVFDPQSMRVTLSYRTPVLAPAAVAWRARNASGRAITSLRFAYRGSQHYPADAKRLIYGPGTHAPCGVNFAALEGSARICKPTFNYRLAGVPARAVGLSVYAWDWAGNRSVLTSRLSRGA
jgi:hypothetical protein